MMIKLHQLTGRKALTYLLTYFKVRVTVTEFGFIQWNHDYFCYMFSTADCLATNLVWQCMFVTWSILWKGCSAVFMVKVTMKVLNFSQCLPGQYLWSIKLSMVIHHHQPEHHSEISFCYVQGQSHNHSTRSSEILLLQSKLHDRVRHSEKIFLLLHRACVWLDDCWLDWSHYPKQGSIPVPVKKTWQEHCFCNEYTCLLSFLVNCSSVWFLYPFVLVMMSP